ncbi:hypothetical protein PV10_06116 [Exophiala mesophila]|uniref:Uncharacterized protein n=1 Tax=Exophiala mesophila TaxID=212818 RepID=A0A0D1ZAA0_EXOME|nr:uncharacterized protein PV10_06116 [Exophiala mesophila]KIV91597.1 hypothetical protein PV10_06116 [Exophiala mesophila]
MTGKIIYTNNEVVFGRDPLRCHYVLDDPHISKRHVRIYTVVYENEEPNDVDTLVYAEDLSHNGTFWNGSLIGKGNGGFLLSNGDVLRLSQRTFLCFTSLSDTSTSSPFNLTQENEMAQFRHDYVVTDRLLGAGAFGKVFMAIEQHTRKQIACKLIDLRRLAPRSTSFFGRPEQPEPADKVDTRVQQKKIKKWINQKKREIGVEKKLKQYFREVEILASISHPNIINIEKVYITDNTMYMMHGLVTAGDLFSYIEAKNGKLLEAEAAAITRQLLIAVQFLHQQHVVHRDIKPDNILMSSLSPGCRVVLTDFGAARRLQGGFHRMSTMIGTHEYAAPEMLEIPNNQNKQVNVGYTRAVDMWAIGCVSVVLLTGGLAFFDPNTGSYSERLAKACDLEYLRKSTEWQCVRSRPKSFVESLLVRDEAQRMTAEQALSHEWFSNEIHDTDFHDLYQRCIKHWRPTVPKAPLVKFLDNRVVKNLRCSREYLCQINKKHPSRSRTNMPVDAPLKPFPMAMHRALQPQRGFKPAVSEEVSLAIKNTWKAKLTPSVVPGTKHRKVGNEGARNSHPPIDRKAVCAGEGEDHSLETTIGNLGQPQEGSTRNGKSKRSSSEMEGVSRPTPRKRSKTSHFDLAEDGDNGGATPVSSLVKGIRKSSTTCRNVEATTSIHLPR